MPVTRLSVLGLMSGSSLDGIDLAVVDFVINPRLTNPISEWKLRSTGTISYPGGLSAKLSAAASLSDIQVARLDEVLGDFMGTKINDFLLASGEQIDYIASHGHTVRHAPHDGYSLQIGSPARIYTSARVPVVSDFRSADIAAGGQGAPLAPVAEKYLFSGYSFYLNLGGIANLSFHTPEVIKAWDICPCNQLLNFLASKSGMEMDKDGLLASSGTVNETLWSKLQSIIEIPHKGPFSLDNSFISDNFLPVLSSAPYSTTDRLSTTVEYIAESVALQVAAAMQGAQPGHRIFTTGGGAFNTYLISRINSHLEPHGCEIYLPEEVIIHQKEAILMALCGAFRVLGIPNSLASATGAARDTVNGTIYGGSDDHQTGDRRAN